VDEDGDGFIELDELKESMKDTQKMGVPGSPWKMYVDPAQDVICYHNFTTEEKIFEYQMTDEKLMEISRSNYFGEAWHEADAVARAKKEEDWEVYLSITCIDYSFNASYFCIGDTTKLHGETATIHVSFLESEKKA